MNHKSLADVEMNVKPHSEGKIIVLQTATALAVSFFICKIASSVTDLCKIQGGTLPAVTAIVVGLATMLPNQFGDLAPAGETIALVLLQACFLISDTFPALQFVDFL